MIDVSTPLAAPPPPPSCIGCRIIDNKFSCFNNAPALPYLENHTYVPYFFYYFNLEFAYICM